MEDYTYFKNEQGDFTISFRVNTDEELHIAITDTVEHASLICRCLNLCEDKNQKLHAE